MEKSHLSIGLASVLLGAALMVPWPGRAQDTPGEAGVAEVYTRGPMHEAFAAAIAFDPVPGLIVDIAPPAPVQEVVPSQRPVGDNVAWIPGYWAWDEDLGDFLWVSGIWRNPPPDRQWVPGEWMDIGERYQWISGYWEPLEITESTYLPAPPRSLESGPNVPADSESQVWIPGNWEHVGGRYAWSGGYWSNPRADWVWIPASYYWTPRGYVYVGGYWDYSVVHRGVVFAPVRFDQRYRSRGDFQYAPRIVITLAVLTNHLFVRPRYGHYYFGDYYDSRYRQRGYYPSFSYASDRRGYDPIYTHYRWLNRHDQAWERNRRESFEYRRDHVDERPPRTWSAYSSRQKSGRSREDSSVAQRWDQLLAERKDGFRSTSSRERQRYTTQRDELRRYRAQREARDDRPRGRKPEDPAVADSGRVKPPRSPVAGPKPSQRSETRKPPSNGIADPSSRGRSRPETSAKPDRANDREGRPKVDRDKPARTPDRKNQPEGRRTSPPKSKPSVAPPKQDRKKAEPQHQPPAKREQPSSRQPRAKESTKPTQAKPSKPVRITKGKQPKNPADAAEELKKKKKGKESKSD
ncbi:MAG: hypothetical protein ACKV19_00665 [Verrucomicrobiales bacterium]